MSLRYKASRVRDLLFHAGVPILGDGRPTFQCLEEGGKPPNRRERKLWQRLVIGYYDLRNKAGDPQTARADADAGSNL